MTFLLTTLLFATPTPEADHRQASKHRPTCLLKKKELRHLIATARTEDDHLRLAAYYRCKAKLLARKAQEHADEADAFASGRLFEPKTGIPGGLLAHCRQFSAYYWQQARRAEEMAESQEKLTSHSRQQ